MYALITALLEHKRAVIVSVIVFLVVMGLWQLPLATVETESANQLYISGTLQPKTTEHVRFGLRKLGSAAPLHAMSTKTALVLPFFHYSVDPEAHEIGVNDILHQAGVKLDSPYVVGSHSFLLSSRWLIVNVGSTVPDGGAYSLILNWQPDTTAWTKISSFDGSTSEQLTGLVPPEVLDSLGITQ